jgi:hypothetical protein
MKTIFNLCFFYFLSAVTAFCQTAQRATAASPTPFSIIQRSANSRVWEQTTYELSSSGQVIPHVHHYTELASGLCYQQNGQWMDSQEQINILPDGSAAATNGQYQAYFPADIYNGIIKLVTPDGLQLQSQPLGLSYDDGTNTVLIAELTNSVGELINSNQIIYANAFVGIDADLLYTYRKGGFEQDVVFREQPPTPEEFGMNSTNSRLQMLTEFLNPPSPMQKATSIKTVDGLQDATLIFGQMKMIRGKAFSVGPSSPQNDLRQIPVYKSWVKVNNRDLLIEQTPYRRIGAQLSYLPANTISFASSANSILHRLSTKRLLPLARITQESTNRMQLAMANIGHLRGVVLDYVTLDSAEDNYTFQGDTTYYISGSVDLSGTTTLEGGTVIKFEAGGDASLVIDGTLNCEGGPYCPSVLTACDDNSIGDTIGSGSPSGYYAGNALDLEGSGAIDYVTILYAETGIYSPGDVTVTNVQIMYCDYGTYIWSEGNSIFENILVANVNTAFGAYMASSSFTENATVANCGVLMGDDSDFGGNFYTYNCILGNVTNLLENSGFDTIYGSNNGFYNCSGAPNPGSFDGTTITYWPFQTVGGGNYYLLDSTFRGLGTATLPPAVVESFNLTSINSELLGQLAQKTTWPPTVYSNVIITNLTLGPIVARDTNGLQFGYLDLGYHYDPLDYAFGGCNLYSNLTFTAGTALGWFENYNGVGPGQPYAISLNNGAHLSFSGNVTQPVWVARFDMAQEGENGSWLNRGYIGGFMFSGNNMSFEPLLSANFTKFSHRISEANLFRDSPNYGEVSCKNCEFYTGGFTMYDMQYGYFTNCLFYRYGVSYFDSSYDPNITYENCTFYNGDLDLERRTGNGGYSSCFWLVENCSFDGTAFEWHDDYNGNTAHTLFNYNAYNTNNLSWTNYPYSYPPIYGTNEVVGLYDSMVTNYNWETSWLGSFYLPVNSPLLQQGSTNANLLGLYHFTTQTNQTPEGTNIVDIGYHYVATDQYGNPLDSNGDGIPDYLEDAAGNGSGNWDTTLFLNVIISQPRNGSTLP